MIADDVEKQGFRGEKVRPTQLISGTTKIILYCF